MNIVECTDVKKTYRQGKVEIQALRGVNLAIEEGGFVALAGPSGSGKTTLLNLIGGLDSMDAGSVVVDGNTLNKMNQSELARLRLKKIGFVFQAYNLIPVLSALENVEYIMLLQGIPTVKRRDLARSILNDVGLEGTYNRRPAELSGGQQQRVAVARAIVSNPSIVLADEPTANLDAENSHHILKMMVRLNQDLQTTFLFATHDEKVIGYLRRIISLRDGRVADDTGN